jgi:pimeloyl-ACP methyl ester carboxylesterase
MLPVLLAAMQVHHGIAYERTGSGPVVLFIHGLGGDHSVWSHDTARLAKTHTVIAVDLPGHGRSPAPSKIDLDQIATHLAEVVRDENVAPVILVGHSIGGIIASILTVQNPDLVRALVVVDTSPGPIPFPLSERDGMRTRMRDDERKELTAFFGQMTTGPAQTQQLVDRAARVPTKVLMGYLDAAAEQGARDQMGSLDLPVLLLGSPILLPGKKSPLEEARSAGFADVRDLTVERFRKSAHWLFLDEPAKFETVLDRFLARVTK